MILIKKYMIISFTLLLSVFLITGCNEKCVQHIDSNNDGCCDKCLDELKIICQHNFLEATCEKPKTCSICGITEGVAKTHKIVIDEQIDATCISTGLTSGAHCSECTEILIKQEVINKLEHHVVIDKGYNQSCTNTGLTDGAHCSLCDEVLIKQEELNADQHQWIEATCTNAKTCSVCGKIEGNPENHDLVVLEGYQATCRDDGLTSGIYCFSCDKVLLKQEVIPAGKHNTIIDKGYKATCTEDGLTDGSHCLTCNIVVNEQTVIKANGHSFEAATYLAPKTCKNCGLTEGSKLECPGHVDENGDKLCDRCNYEIKEYAPKWNLNVQTNHWNGYGMTVKIYVTDVSAHDPFNAYYIKTDKKIMQRHVRDIEREYGIDLVFENWSNVAAWGPARVNYIKQENLQNDNAYIIEIDSTWINDLVKSNRLAELATLDSINNISDGIFTEIGYVETEPGSGIYVPGTYAQDSNYNPSVTVNNKIYGYVHGKARPDYFMYYNADLIARSGMKDPAELWLRGEWTWSYFENYCNQLQNNLNDNERALSVGFAEFIIGSTYSMGNKILTNEPYFGLISNELVNRFRSIQNLYSSGYYEFRNFEDVSTGFLNSKVAFVHGELWFIDNPNRFNPDLCNFTIGVVPYPTNDFNGGIPITTTDKNEAIKGYNGKLVETYEGSNEYICGVDMSESDFMVPQGNTSCFSIMDTTNGENSINNKILFSILYDLYEAVGDDPEFAKVSDDTNYRKWLSTKFYSELYVEVIMSVQGCVYPDLVENVSCIVGSGSLISYGAFWGLASQICKNSTIDPVYKLNEVYESYKQAMKELGYTI